MPAARPVLILLAFVSLPTFFTFFSLLSAHPRNDSASETTPPQRGTFRSFFSFHAPSTLFPPAAIISLTDDNSTFFLARPADFGPRLISRGLSGQLWVGSGFGDDNIRKGGVATGPEGELGCSDVPGWEDGDKERHGDVGFSKSKNSKNGLPRMRQNRVDKANTTPVETTSETATDGQDHSGSTDIRITDDHLHSPLTGSELPVALKAEQIQRLDTGSVAHADIQTLQESAEIAGKIVLLSRGGCGFLEKVKWAQRRGAAALIIGDDTRGGALVTMYARGDTSNVTIPSLFTSHTTAHLLSSLIPPEGTEDDEDPDGGAKKDTSEILKDNELAKEDRPNFTATLKDPKATSTTPAHRPSISSKGRPISRTRRTTKSINSVRKQSFWHELWFGKAVKDQALGADSRRPPSSGRLTWTNEHFDDELAMEKRNVKSSDNSGKTAHKPKRPTKNQHDSADGFEIGIQDWRDPDLVATKSGEGKDGRKQHTAAAVPTATKIGLHEQQKGTSLPSDKKVFSGGIITPGSGEYGHTSTDDEGEDDQHSWISHALWGEDHQDATEGITDDEQGPMSDSLFQTGEQDHEGLWVTLTPTTMSTTPFFDTLLVLVASPLITLTVVYALLLLRSRIRRRRWRAPKSVVERLPVRTYQTMPTSSTTSSARMATPYTSSPTSPLLQSRTQSIHSRSRAQSRADSGSFDHISVSLDKATAQAAARDREKIERSVAKKQKYKGRQIECVVCLEEYVEGQSQVMSLPCGHEFHADCITPWLTTRRRTCPICKNDVVRSMARSSKAAEASASDSPYPDNPPEDDVQVLAAETTNDSPSAAIPIPRDNHDLERGDDMADTLVEDQSSRGWRGLASFSLSAFSGEAVWRQAQADRNR